MIAAMHDSSLVPTRNDSKMSQDSANESSVSTHEVTIPKPTKSENSNALLDRSFWGLAITQFLGAFNDNLYKQLILLMAIPAIGGDISEDSQGWATAVFSLPFVLFSGFAGYLSDKYSKSIIIVLSKIAEVVIMLMAVVAFLSYATMEDWGTWSVLFLMGLQSTFFGPAKYGILPELFQKEELPRINGLILMSTFLAIILGVVTAGVLKDVLVVADEAGNPNFGRLWIGSVVCAVIAIVGTYTSFLIRKTPAAQPTAVMSLGDFGVSQSIRTLLWNDKPLLAAILVSSMFYVIAGVVMPTVNVLGKIQLQVQWDSYTSLLTGGLAIGIIIGAVLAIVVLKQIRPGSQVLLGTIGMFITLVLLGFWKPGGAHLLGYWGALIGLITTGMFAAVFIVPIQVFMQSRPPAETKGRMIGTMNFANFVGILIAGPLYQLFLIIATSIGWPVSSIFWMLAVLLIPIAIRFRLPAGA
jgi:acyl-[acyl-carrier-protein]-phospholipid O-acyltransferase/long-chain-fatty-acid--[acyl-carrier-protein] ligase